MKYLKVDTPPEFKNTENYIQKKNQTTYKNPISVYTPDSNYRPCREELQQLLQENNCNNFCRVIM